MSVFLKDIQKYEPPLRKADLLLTYRKEYCDFCGLVEKSVIRVKYGVILIEDIKDSFKNFKK